MCKETGAYTTGGVKSWVSAEVLFVLFGVSLNAVALIVFHQWHVTKTLRLEKVMVADILKHAFLRHPPFSVSADKMWKDGDSLLPFRLMERKIVMADPEGSGENVKSTGANETASGPTVQQALLISCMQKIVIYETKAVSWL